MFSCYPSSEVGRRGRGRYDGLVNKNVLFLKPEFLEKTINPAWQLVPSDFNSKILLIHLANLNFITNQLSLPMKRERVSERLSHGESKKRVL